MAAVPFDLNQTTRAQGIPESYGTRVYSAFEGQFGLANHPRNDAVQDPETGEITFRDRGTQTSIDYTHGPDGGVKVNVGYGKIIAEGTADSVHSLQMGGQAIAINERTLNVASHTKLLLESGNSFDTALGQAAGAHGYSSSAHFLRDAALRVENGLGRHAGVLSVAGPAIIGGATLLAGGTKAQAAEATANAIPGIRITQAKTGAEAATRALGDIGNVVPVLGPAVTGTAEEVVRFGSDVARSAGFETGIQEGIVRSGARLAAASAVEGGKYIAAKAEQIFDHVTGHDKPALNEQAMGKANDKSAAAMPTQRHGGRPSFRSALPLGVPPEPSGTLEPSAATQSAAKTPTTTTVTKHPAAKMTFTPF